MPVTLPVTPGLTDLPVFTFTYCTGVSCNTFRNYYYPEKRNIKLVFKQDFYKVNLFYELRLTHDWMPSEWAARNHKIEFKLAEKKRIKKNDIFKRRAHNGPVGVTRQRMSPINGTRSLDCTASMSKIVSGLSLSPRRKSGLFRTC